MNAKNRHIAHSQSSPLVSVWMITYNHEKFVAEAIESILNQETNFPFEIVIGEDCSTDETANIVKLYAEKYPNIVKARLNKTNIGVMPNMIKTLQECSGKYIALCEGDDYWTDPQKLQKQVAFLEEHSDYVACYHDAKIVDHDGNLLNETKLTPPFRRDFSSDELMKGAWALTLSLVFRNVIKEYPEEMLKVTNGDIFLLVLLGKHGKGKYLDTVTPAAYRKHLSSIWSSLDIEEQSFKAFNSYLHMYQYHLRENGREFATEFLFEVVFPAFKTLHPQSNPHQRAMEQQIANSDRLLRDIYASRTFKAGSIALWPLKKLKTLLSKIRTKPTFDSKSP